MYTTSMVLSPMEVVTMVQVTEKHRDVSFVELVQFMMYLEEKYGAVAEVHVSTDEANPADALLCITSVGKCRLHRDIRSRAFASRTVPYSQLQRVPYVLLELFYEITEQIDGACEACLADAARLN